MNVCAVIFGLFLCAAAQGDAGPGVRDLQKIEIELDIFDDDALVVYNDLWRSKARVSYAQKKKIVAYRDERVGRCLLQRIRKADGAEGNDDRYARTYRAAGGSMSKDEVVKLAGKKIAVFCEKYPSVLLEEYVPLSRTHRARRETYNAMRGNESDISHQEISKKLLEELVNADNLLPNAYHSVKRNVDGGVDNGVGGVYQSKMDASGVDYQARIRNSMQPSAHPIDVTSSVTITTGSSGQQGWSYAPSANPRYASSAAQPNATTHGIHAAGHHNASAHPGASSHVHHVYVYHGAIPPGIFPYPSGFKSQNGTRHPSGYGHHQAYLPPSSKYPVHYGNASQASYSYAPQYPPSSVSKLNYLPNIAGYVASQAIGQNGSADAHKVAEYRPSAGGKLYGGYGTPQFGPSGRSFPPSSSSKVGFPSGDGTSVTETGSYAPSSVGKSHYAPGSLGGASYYPPSSASKTHYGPYGSFGQFPPSSTSKVHHVYHSGKPGQQFPSSTPQPHRSQALPQPSQIAQPAAGRFPPSATSKSQYPQGGLSHHVPGRQFPPSATSGSQGAVPVHHHPGGGQHHHHPSAQIGLPHQIGQQHPSGGAQQHHQVLQQHPSGGAQQHHQIMQQHPSGGAQHHPSGGQQQHHHHHQIGGGPQQHHQIGQQHPSAGQHHSHIGQHHPVGGQQHPGAGQQQQQHHQIGQQHPSGGPQHSGAQQQIGHQHPSPGHGQQQIGHQHPSAGHQHHQIGLQHPSAGQHHPQMGQHPVGGQQHPQIGQQHLVGGQQHLVGGQQHLVGGQQHQVGGQQHPVGGQQPQIGQQHPGGGQHPVGGQQHPIGGQQHPIGGQQHPIGGQQHPIGGQQHQIGGQQHQIGGQQHQIDGQQHQIGGQQHQIGGQQHPVGGQQPQIGQQHPGGGQQHHQIGQQLPHVQQGGHQPVAYYPPSSTSKLHQTPLGQNFSGPGYYGPSSTSKQQQQHSGVSVNQQPGLYVSSSVSLTPGQASYYPPSSFAKPAYRPLGPGYSAQPSYYGPSASSQNGSSSVAQPGLYSPHYPPSSSGKPRLGQQNATGIDSGKAGHPSGSEHYPGQRFNDSSVGQYRPDSSAYQGYGVGQYPPSSSGGQQRQGEQFSSPGSQSPCQGSPRSLYSITTRTILTPNGVIQRPVSVKTNGNSPCSAASVPSATSYNARLAPCARNGQGGRTQVPCSANRANRQSRNTGVIMPGPAVMPVRRPDPQHNREAYGGAEESQAELLGGPYQFADQFSKLQKENATDVKSEESAPEFLDENGQIERDVEILENDDGGYERARARPVKYVEDKSGKTAAEDEERSAKEDEPEEMVKEGDILQPGDRILGKDGYTVSEGFRARVVAVTGQVGKKRAEGNAPAAKTHATVKAASTFAKFRYSSELGRYVKDETEDSFSNCHGELSFTCTEFFGSNGRAKICKPNPRRNPDGTPCQPSS